MTDLPNVFLHVEHQGNPLAFTTRDLVGPLPRVGEQLILLDRDVDIDDFSAEDLNWDADHLGDGWLATVARVRHELLDVDLGSAIHLDLDAQNPPLSSPRDPAEIATLLRWFELSDWEHVEPQALHVDSAAGAGNR